jgi:hypothetical protein
MSWTAHIHPSEWKADPPHTYKVDIFDIFFGRKKAQEDTAQKYPKIWFYVFLFPVTFVLYVAITRRYPY